MNTLRNYDLLFKDSNITCLSRNCFYFERGIGTNLPVSCTLCVNIKLLWVTFIMLPAFWKYTYLILFCFGFLFLDGSHFTNNLVTSSIGSTTPPLNSQMLESLIRMVDVKNPIPEKHQKMQVGSTESQPKYETKITLRIFSPLKRPYPLLMKQSKSKQKMSFSLEA